MKRTVETLESYCSNSLGIWITEQYEQHTHTEHLIGDLSVVYRRMELSPHNLSAVRSIYTFKEINAIVYNFTCCLFLCFTDTASRIVDNLRVGSTNDQLKTTYNNSSLNNFFVIRHLLHHHHHHHIYIFIYLYNFILLYLMYCLEPDIHKLSTFTQMSQFTISLPPLSSTAILVCVLPLLKIVRDYESQYYRCTWTSGTSSETITRYRHTKFMAL